ncbi:MAG: hypothetical protein QXH73_03935 [Ignisphaera sp.]
MVRIHYKFKDGKAVSMWYVWSRSKRVKVIDFDNKDVEKMLTDGASKLNEIIEKVLAK